MNESNQKSLSELKQEINSLEYQKKHFSSISTKNKAIKNLKIFARGLQFIAPYALTAGIVIGGFGLLGHSPFSLDEHKSYAKVMTEFDNDGNIRIEKQYDDFRDGKYHILNNNDSMLYYYSKWRKTDDGLYLRTAQAYSIKEKSFEDIMNLFKKEDLKLEDVLGKPFYNIEKTKENLTEEEIQEESIIKAVIYNEDKSEYISHKETVGENIALSTAGLLMIMILELIPASCSSFDRYDFLDSINKIKREYKQLDIDSIIEILEQKKDDYNKLSR